jgi:alpha-amylase
MKLLPTLIGALLVSLAIHVSAKSGNDWRSKSIYQIITDRFARTDGSTTAPCDPSRGEYCGGTFQGIIKHLDYIQNLGFSAIWISPVTYQLQPYTKDLGAYHGYWQQNLYALNSAFGTDADLKALANELHSRNMYLMLDVVVNDFAWAGAGTSVDFTKFNPFNNEDYFHQYRLLSSDVNNNTCVEECWLGDTVVSLPDLKTETPQVSSMLCSWAQEMISNYSVDGLRIDSVFNVNPDFLSGFNNAANVFCIGEGSTKNVTAACSLQGQLNGMLNYPRYYALTEAFNSTNGSLSDLMTTVNGVNGSCKDILELGTFSENHDVPRFASYTNDLSLAGNIIAYTILGDGIPIIYNGQEQHYSGAFNPVNREAVWLSSYNENAPLYKVIQSLNQIRSHAAGNGSQFTESSEPSQDYIEYLSYPFITQTHILALRKGFKGNQVIMVLSNLGSNPASSEDTNAALPASQTGFHPGQNVTEILSCKTVTTDSSGQLNISLNDGGPRVYYPTLSLNQSGICGHLVAGSTKSGAWYGRDVHSVTWFISLAGTIYLAVYILF